jgi:hypothetical protein
LQSIQADELWLLIGDESRDVTVKIVANTAFDRVPLIESVGHTILFQHVYVLNASQVFFDDMASIPSSYELNPTGTEYLLDHFKGA